MRRRGTEDIINIVFTPKLFPSSNEALLRNGNTINGVVLVDFPNFRKGHLK